MRTFFASKYKSTSHNLSSRGISILNCFCAYTYTSTHTHTHTLTHTSLFGSEIVAVGIKSDVSAALHAPALFLSLWRHAQRHHAIAPSSATLSLHPSLQLSLVTVSFSQSASSSSCTSLSLAHTCAYACSLTHSYALVLSPAAPINRNLCSHNASSLP